MDGPARGAAVRVLVVDDSPADRERVVRALRRGLPGVELVEAGDGTGWERALGGERCDVAIIDYRLPFADGLELLRALKGRWPGLPVLMLTGTASDVHALQAVEEGLDDYLPKSPESYAVLARTVRFALERARQRRALVESREMLRLVLEGVRDHAIFLLDAQGRVATWSPGAHRLSGRAESEVLGRPFELLLGEEGAWAAGALMEAARSGGFDGEGWLPRQGGAPYWAEVTVGALTDEEGTLRGSTWVVRDATERRRAEQELAATAEFRDRFLGIVSHDLRNPLQAILLQAQALVRAPRGETVPRVAERIAAQAGRMTRMIADLLDLTRVRFGGGLPMERRALDAFPLCREVVEELEAAHPGRTVVLQLEGDGRGEWDADRLAQVVQNLVGNALAHGLDGTPVAVRLRGEPGLLQLAVHNQGPPIPEALLPHLFDPFRQGEERGRGRRASGALGLGLYIVQQVVHAHGGSIHVASTEGEGTTFTVRLPRPST